jgi:surface protein
MSDEGHRILQKSVTGSCNQQQSINTHWGRILQPVFVFIFLIALCSFSITGHAQVSTFSGESSAQAGVVVADEFASGPIGSGHNWMEFDPPYFEYKGWFDPATYELRTVAPSSTLQVFDLLPADEEGSAWPGLRVLKVERADASDYYFSYRQQTGPDNYIPSSYTNGVGLHWGDEDGFSYFHRMIRRADVFADADTDLVVWGMGPMRIENPEFNDDTRVFTLKVCNTTCSSLVPPAKLAAQYIDAGSIQLTWQDYTHNEDGFTVEYSTDGADWTALATAAANEVYYVHSGIDVGNTFSYYRVRAFRGESEASDWSNIVSATKPATTPGIASKLAPRTNTGASDLWSTLSVTNDAPAADDPPLTDHFVTTWQTDNPGTSNETSITVPMVGGPYDIDWDDDGTFDELGLTGSVTHDYDVAGRKTIRIRGVYSSISFSNGGDKEKIISLDQWGTNAWTTMSGAFYGCVNLRLPATDTPNFSGVTDMRFMFYDASAVKPNVGSWDTSSVTNMSSMFFNATSANPDVSAWDTSSVTNMSSMFFNAGLANPDVSNWNTSSVTNMSSMFGSITTANPDVSNWDTSSVTNMSSMFGSAASANPDVSNWHTSSVTNMSSMFFNTSSANPDVSSWNTSSVSNMSSMFGNAALANPDVSNWDTSSVTNMSWMFVSAASANPDVSNWDTSSVTNMLRMFGSATSANPDVSNWDTSSVIDMSSMFSGATSANPDVSGWDTSSVTSMHSMFASAALANPDVSNWNTSSVITTRSMFEFATSFNRDLGSWNVTSLSDASNMLRGVTLSTTNYDSLLVGWDGQELQQAVTLDGGSSKHCSDEAVAARANMIATDFWTIIDGGFDCTPSFEMNAGLNDAWFDPATSGQGFTITVFPGVQKVFLSWFTFDTERPNDSVTASLGEPGHRWLTALGDISGNKSEMVISIASGGVFDTATDISRFDDGTITLTFTDCNSGTVEYDIPSINQQGTIPIERIVPGTNIALCESMSETTTAEQASSRQQKDDTDKLLAGDFEGTFDTPPLAEMNAGLNDAWFDPATSGQGFTITVFPGVQKVFLSWFTFDTERPDDSITANLGEPGHRWLTALGDISGNKSEMVISVASGGIFDTATDISRFDDGTITLTFTDCNTGTVAYDIPSINQQGSIPIERIVAGANIARCESLSE